MPAEAVSFKGTREGIHIQLNDEVEFARVLESLQNRLAVSPGFFQGARIILNTGRRSLTEEQVNAVRQVLSQYDDVQLIRLEQKKTAAPETAGEMTALVVEKTIHSGQQVIHPGHIVILGDVNPGAELIAEGNITVMGALRGVAHAGVKGRTDAFVAATLLAPIQVSIAGVLARHPDENEAPARRVPEVARLRDGSIVVEPYNQANFD
ncbi:MAG: septum site-determining protein MinC [Bacillota bacterium]